MVYRNMAPPPRTRKQHVLDAVKQASQVRRDINIPLTAPVTVADAAQRLGVEVLYKADVNSMEGLYLRTPKPRIIVSSTRPVGRQAFTIGHELGHHVYKHKGHVLSAGTDKADEHELVQKFNPEEVLADAFAAHFLLPKLTVMHAFKVRELSYDTCTASDMYNIAWWFGVGYETLIRHMQTTLKLISPDKATELRKETPKKIRLALLGYDIIEDLIPVDFHWDGSRAVDAQSGDILILPPGTSLDPGTNNAHILLSGSNSTLIEALLPGTTRLLHRETGWAVYMRVSRRQYAGLARYRFLPDDEEEEMNNDSLTTNH